MTLLLDPRRETEITLAAIDELLGRVEQNIAAIRAELTAPVSNHQSKDDDAGPPHYS